MSATTCAECVQYVRLRNLGRNDGTFTNRSHVLRPRNGEPWTACGFGLHVSDSPTSDRVEDDPSALICGNCARITGGR